MLRRFSKFWSNCHMTKFKHFTTVGFDLAKLKFLFAVRHIGLSDKFYNFPKISFVFGDSCLH